MNTARQLVRTVDNVHQFYNTRCAFETLQLHSCLIDPLSSVFNGKKWLSSGTLIDYKSASFIRFGNMNDLLHIQCNLYENLNYRKPYNVEYSRDVLTKFKSKLHFYKDELVEILILDGNSVKKSKFLVNKCVQIANGEQSKFEYDSNVILKQVGFATTSILSGEDCSFVGDFNMTLSHIAIQNIVNNVLYNSECIHLSTLFIKG
jgi:hypothetical protein